MGRLELEMPVQSALPSVRRTDLIKDLVVAGIDV